MTTSPGAAPDPHHEPVHDLPDTLPDGEQIDPSQVQEQLETEPEEAENFTDGYAPEDDLED